MQAGKLRHKVTVEQNVPTRDAVGAEVDSWQTFLTARASIEPMSGREAYVQGIDQRFAQRLTKITIRFREGLTTKMRVVWGSKTFNIQQIVTDPTNARQIDLIGEEINV